MYEWLNPPVGTFTEEEYLKMHEHWMASTSCSSNEVSLKADPLRKRFFGNLRLNVDGDTVTLSAI